MDVLSADWLGICRRVVAAQQAIFEEVKGRAARTVYVGQGEGGERLSTVLRSTRRSPGQRNWANGRIAGTFHGPLPSAGTSCPSAVANRAQLAFNGEWIASTHRTALRTCEPLRAATRSLKSLFGVRFTGWDFDFASTPVNCQVLPTSSFARAERRFSSTDASGTATRGVRKLIGQKLGQNSGMPNWTGIMSVMGRLKPRSRVPDGQFWLSGSAKRWKVNISGTG